MHHRLVTAFLKEQPTTRRVDKVRQMKKKPLGED